MRKQWQRERENERKQNLLCVVGHLWRWRLQLLSPKNEKNLWDRRRLGKRDTRRDRRLKLKAVKEAKISGPERECCTYCTCARMEIPLLLSQPMQLGTLFTGWIEKWIYCLCRLCVCVCAWRLMGLHVNPCESTCWCMHVPPPLLSSECYQDEFVPYVCHLRSLSGNGAGWQCILSMHISLWCRWRLCISEQRWWKKKVPLFWEEVINWVEKGGF